MRVLTARTAALLATFGLATLGISQAPRQTLDPASVKRGDALYTSLSCVACHGVAGQGGTNNAADLTTSALAQTPDDGRTLSAFLLVGRPELGMPPARPLSATEAADLSAKIRSLAAPPAAPADDGGSASREGGSAARARADASLPAALAGQTLSILVGDPKLGKLYFNGAVGKCASCHAVEEGRASPAANLAHIAAKYKSPKELQNNMLLPRDLAWSPRNDTNVTAIATFADGHEVRGTLTSVSDFKLVIRDAAGTATVIPRDRGEPKVRLIDRLQAHLDQLKVYQDSDIHDLTAYLASLK